VFAVGNARSTRHAATAVSYYGRWAIQKSDDGARSFCPICSRRRRNVTVLQHDLIDIVEHDVQDVLTDIARLKFRGITFFVQDQSMSSEVERRTTVNRAMKTACGACGLPWGGKGEMLTQVERISKRIIMAAGLLPELTFISFGRHGGTTKVARSEISTTQNRQPSETPDGREILLQQRIIIEAKG